MIYRKLFGLPSLRFRSPFEELSQMRRQMDRLFENAMTPYERPLAGVFPLINLTEDRNSYFIRAELPGVKAEELDIQATGNNISITGKRNIASEEEGAKYHRKEREAGSFSRAIALPGDIDTGKIKAKLTDGVLTLAVAKAEAAKPKQIAVQ